MSPHSDEVDVPEERGNSVGGTGELSVVIWLQEPVLNLIEVAPSEALQEVGEVGWVGYRESGKQEHELWMMEELVDLGVPVPQEQEEAHNQHEVDNHLAENSEVLRPVEDGIGLVEGEGGLEWGRLEGYGRYSAPDQQISILQQIQLHQLPMHIGVQL